MEQPSIPGARAGVGRALSPVMTPLLPDDQLNSGQDRPSRRREDRIDTSYVELLVGELARTTDRIQSLRATATTIIQLSIFALAAGIAAFRALPVALALVPVLFSVWLFYLFAINRETIKHVEHRVWLERTLNLLCEPPTFKTEGKVTPFRAPFQWETVEGATVGSTPWMLYGIYALATLANLSGWVLSAIVLYHECKKQSAPAFSRHWADGIVAAYVIIATLVGLAFGLSWRSQSQLERELQDALADGSISTASVETSSVYMNLPWPS